MRLKTSYSKYHYQLKQSQQYWVKNEDDMNCRNTILNEDMIVAVLIAM